MHEENFCRFFGAYAKIYTLADKYGNVFYVGCTTASMEKRLLAHISAAQSNIKRISNKKKNEKIRSLNFEIFATIVEMKWTTGKKAIYALRNIENIEKEWIGKYRDLGYDLCNGGYPRKKKKDKKAIEFVGQTYKANGERIIQAQPY